MVPPHQPQRRRQPQRQRRRGMRLQTVLDSRIIRRPRGIECSRQRLQARRQRRLPAAFGVRRLLPAAAIALLASGAGTVSAQSWPSRPVTLVVPYTPGTGQDTQITLPDKRTEVTDASGGGLENPNVPSANSDAGKEFVARVLGSNNRVWGEILGSNYQKPKLVLFSGFVQSACGNAQAAMGPFYCPADQKVYIDLSFYQDMKNKLGAPGDFAQACVIAHEVGHHVQNLLGIADKVTQARMRASKADANALSVRMELQADCFSGIWAQEANASAKILEDGDIEEEVGEVLIGHDRAIHGDDEGFFAEARDVLQDAPQVGGFHLGDLPRGGRGCRRGHELFARLHL